MLRSNIFSEDKYLAQGCLTLAFPYKSYQGNALFSREYSKFWFIFIFMMNIWDYHIGYLYDLLSLSTTDGHRLLQDQPPWRQLIARVNWQVKIVLLAVQLVDCYGQRSAVVDFNIKSMQECYIMVSLEQKVLPLRCFKRPAPSLISV